MTEEMIGDHGDDLFALSDGGANDSEVAVPEAELDLAIPSPEAVPPPIESIGAALFGLDLFGDSAEPVREGQLSKRFTFPPFTVLNAREGDWQARKRAWVSMGLQSEVGRGGNLLIMPDTILAIQNGENPTDAKDTPTRLKSGLTCGISIHPYDGKGYEGKDAKFGKTFNAAEFQNKNKQGLLHKGETIDTASGESWDGGRSAWQNNGTSIFDPVLCELCYRWFCPAGGQIVDPFAGGSVRGVVAGLLGFRYYGIDLRQEQIEANVEQRDRIIGPSLPGMEADGNAVQWACGDSRDLVGEAPLADFIFSCPPYGDLEQYSDDPLDLSAMSHAEFMVAYREIIRKSAERLKDDRLACFVVGDFRDKKTGYYRGFVADTINAFRDAGMHLYNDAILVTSVGSLPVRLSGQFEGGRKLGKTHQNVLVFAKGDPRKAFQEKE